MIKSSGPVCYRACPRERCSYTSPTSTVFLPSRTKVSRYVMCQAGNCNKRSLPPLATMAAVISSRVFSVSLCSARTLFVSVPSSRRSATNFAMMEPRVGFNGQEKPAARLLGSLTERRQEAGTVAVAHRAPERAARLGFVLGCRIGYSHTAPPVMFQLVPAPLRGSLFSQFRVTLAQLTHGDSRQTGRDDE